MDFASLLATVLIDAKIMYDLVWFEGKVFKFVNIYYFLSKNFDLVDLYYR